MKTNIFIIGTLFFAISCGQKNSRPKVNKSVRESVDVSLLAPCQYSFFDGEDVDYSVAPQVFESDPFGKNISSFHLERIYKASASATVQYIETALDADVLKVVPTSTSLSDCQIGGVAFFETLPTASYDFMRFWDNQAQSVAGNKKNMLGIYLENATSYYPLLPPRPTILLNSVTTRWTLIHEMAHHLYQMEQGIQTRGAALYKRWKLAKNRFERAYRPLQSDDATVSQLQNALAPFEDYFKLSLKMLEAFSLEEVAIEMRLYQAYKQGRIAYVEPEMKQNSYAYIQTNARSTLTKIEDLKKIIEQLSKDYTQKETINASLQDDFNHKLSKLTQIETNLKETINTLVTPTNWVNSLKSHQHDVNVHCSHGAKTHNFSLKL